jgi:hypothetical protein
MSDDARRRAEVLEAKAYAKIREDAKRSDFDRHGAMVCGFCPNCGFDLIFDEGVHDCGR